MRHNHLNFVLKLISKKNANIFYIEELTSFTEILKLLLFLLLFFLEYFIIIFILLLKVFGKRNDLIKKKSFVFKFKQEKQQKNNIKIS